MHSGASSYYSLVPKRLRGWAGSPWYQPSQSHLTLLLQRNQQNANNMIIRGSSYGHTVIKML